MGAVPTVPSSLVLRCLSPCPACFRHSVENPSRTCFYLQQAQLEENRTCTGNATKTSLLELWLLYVVLVSPPWSSEPSARGGKDALQRSRADEEDLPRHAVQVTQPHVAPRNARTRSLARTRLRQHHGSARSCLPEHHRDSPTHGAISAHHRRHQEHALLGTSRSGGDDTARNPPPPP